tara:strand:- start:227 stop:982 length:756 start_codon:yes stop_codon:yes gene_type:complete
MKKNIEKKGSMLSSKKQYGIQDLRASLFDKSKGSTLDKINSFTKYAGRQNIAKLVAQYEMLMMTKNVLGNIIEGGIFHGSGLLGWANLAVSLEPYNYQCKIIGFDTFTGSTGITSKDQTLSNIKRREKEYNANNYNDILKTIEIFDLDRPLNHIKKIEVIKGDISKTIPLYIKKNKQLTVRILHLGMNLYKPTYHSLKNLIPRMSKGSIIAIDGLNHATPGCLDALRENLELSKIKLKTFDYYPNFSYFII